jgi:RNA polymerase sigma-70 factor (ECF subfamily)
MSEPVPDTDRVAVFAEHQKLLFGVAYRMLGSVAEADDVVQETWLRWDRVPEAERAQIRDARAYLAKIASRAALDQLRRAQTRRETYSGPWLPEPLVTEDLEEQVSQADSVSMALLVVLETLSPLERAVFVLREAFGFSHQEVADALGRSEPSVRQTAKRARAHVEARRPRFEPPPRPVREATAARFLAAAAGGDLAGLLEVLSPDVTLVADGGGIVKAPRRIIEGVDKVARFLAAIGGPAMPEGLSVEVAEVNGEPGIVGMAGGSAVAVFALELDEAGLVRTVRLIGTPEKLGRVPHA